MAHIKATEAGFVSTAILAMAAKERELYEQITNQWRHTQKLYIAVNERNVLVTNALPRKTRGTDLGENIGRNYFTIKNYGIEGMYVGASKFITRYRYPSKTFKLQEGELYEVSRNEFLNRLAMELHI